MIYSGLKAENNAYTNFCDKENSELKKRYPLKAGLKRKLPVLLKVFLLIIIITWISGAVSAHTVTKNSLSSIKIKNMTVIVEQGFSGTVTIKDPVLNRTSNVTVKYQPYCSGSGFVVNKKGYIITAFHVVSDPSTIKHKNKLKKMNSSNVKWYVEEMGLMEYLEKNNRALGYQLFKDVNSANAFEKTLTKTTNNFIKNGWISANFYENDIYVKGNIFKRINASGTLKASLIDFGNCRKNEDIALLKVNTNGTNLPILTIRAKSPKSGAKVSVYGYPYNKKRNYTSKSSGHLIKKIHNSKGVVYYKTNTITAEGYSGGPAVNSRNKVIGVLVYGIFIEVGKHKRNIGSLFLSASYIQKLCKRDKVPLRVI